MTHPDFDMRGGMDARPYEHPITVCQFCGAEVIFATNDRLYGQLFGEWPYIYICTGCSASVGVHKGTQRPLGTLANKETRQARKAAHAAFDPLWKSGRMKRTAAYAWLANEMGLTANECHIGQFDIVQCEQVVALVNSLVSSEAVGK